MASLPLPPGTKLLVYADDVALVATGACHLQRAQQAITAISTKCHSLALKINFNITKAICFNGVRPQAPLRAGPIDIEWVNNHQYLGIQLDHRLNFRHHVQYTADRVRPRLRVMRFITATEGGADFRVLKTFYLQAIRSIFDYAAPLLATVRQTQIIHLERLQNEALRTMLGAPRWAKVCNMRAEAKIPLVQHRINALIIQLPGKKASQPQYANIIERVHQNQELLRKETWASLTANNIKTLQAKTPFSRISHDITHPAYTPTPPWGEAAIQFSITPLTKSKFQLSNTELAHQARQALAAGNWNEADIPTYRRVS